MGALGTPPPQIYAPFVQHAPRHTFFVLKIAPGGGTAGGIAAAAIRQVDRDQVATEVRTLEELRARMFSVPRLLTSLTGCFAAFALSLALMTVYALVSHSATQRTRELGIRMALGASRREVLATVMRRAAWLTALGLSLGLLGALALSHVLRGALFGVPTGNTAFQLVLACTLGSLSLAASWLPARRAAKLDPVAALRAE